jgi:hypothetical protein
MNDEEYKQQVALKHQQRQERLAREAAEKASLAAAAKAEPAQPPAPPAIVTPNLEDFNRRREIAERARRGETAPEQEQPASDPPAA